ncbi:hypothetical protein L4D04_18340 [Photobacterium angustum]|uniref:hypothetical protein n=1 Tax=Photobacterium angustum TaxID=661 RepID=UPI003D0A6BAD
MTDLVKIHPDILMALNKVNIEQFKVTTIRDLIMQVSPNYTNKDTARLFVSRNLMDLVEKGVLTSTGLRHRKRFKKCDDFNLIKFKTKKPYKNQNEQKKSKIQSKKYVLISDSCIKLLKTQKAKMEAELSIKMAETEQYQVMIEEFPETTNVALALHSEAKTNAAEIIGKIRAITNLLSHSHK